MKKVHNRFLALLMLLMTVVLNINNLVAQRKASYVKPYVTRNGKIVSAHYKKSVSISPNAYKNRARSKYYYHSRGKYTRRKR